MLQKRVETYCRRFPGLDITFTPQPLPVHEVALYVIDVYRIAELPSPSLTGTVFVPVLCYGPPESLSTAWESGCADYLKEPWTMTELHFRIDRLLSVPGVPLRSGAITVDDTEIICGGERHQISFQEGRILAMLLRHRGAVVPREALYYSIWGKNGAGSRVVDMHIAALRRKLTDVQRHLSANERVRIGTARREGYFIR